jgi:hypothetical protein
MRRIAKPAAFDVGQDVSSVAVGVCPAFVGRIVACSGRNFEVETEDGSRWLREANELTPKPAEPPQWLAPDGRLA